MLDPNAQSLLTAGGKYGGIFPAPTNGSQFQGGNNVPTNVREEVVRIDENVNDKFTIYGHFVAEQISQNYGTTMWSGDNVPTISNTFGNPSYAGVIHTAYVISPTLVNEACLQLQRESHRDSSVGSGVRTIQLQLQPVLYRAERRRPHPDHQPERQHRSAIHFQLDPVEQRRG